VTLSLPGYDIRYTYITDISHLRRWLQDAAMLHWFPMATEKEVEEALQAWISFSRWSCSLTATINHVPCAVGTLFLLPYQKVAHHCPFKLIVDPVLQRKGIGTSMLRNLRHLAKNYFHLEMINIEVFEGNPITHLLHKEGFVEIVRQEGFVKEEENLYARQIFEVAL
jgi:RimJ/RimL family protein N-acetyltransferase